MAGSTLPRAGAIRAKNDKTEIISGPESGTTKGPIRPLEWNTVVLVVPGLMTAGCYMSVQCMHRPAIQLIVGMNRLKPFQAQDWVKCPSSPYSTVTYDPLAAAILRSDRQNSSCCHLALSRLAALLHGIGKSAIKSGTVQ